MVTLRSLEKTKADFTVATILGVDVSALFRHFYENTEDFERKTEIQIPEDVAEMLAPQAELPEFEEGARLKFALKAYDNEELSTGLAARFAGMSREKFIYTMENMGSLLLGSQLKRSERTLRVPKKPVISNTSPLIGLWALNLFPLLRELYTEVLIPEEVRDEFFATESETREAALKSAPWIRTVRLRNPENIAMHEEVDIGEAAVFALAEEREARLVILDDRDAPTVRRTN